jgi:hypothetical protein
VASAAAAAIADPVRLRDIGERQQQVLRQLAGRISNRLELEITEGAAGEGPNVGLSLQERGQRAMMEVPHALLLRAPAEPAALEALRVRIKATRDRMLFRPPPRPLPKNITPAADPGFGRGGFGRGGGGPGRGRR